MLYGEEQPGLTLAKGRSPGLNPRNPRLHSIAELTTAGHEHFVGRTWELVGLGADIIGSSTGAEVKPIAVITGLGGMGKTALTAEALALWEARFEWVLLYQAKPNRLELETFLRDAHLKLMGELKLYHDHVRANPADAIYRDSTAEFAGPERLQRLTRNLLRAMKDEPILLVLDNFETNLKRRSGVSAERRQRLRNENAAPCRNAATPRFTRPMPGRPCGAKLSRHLANVREVLESGSPLFPLPTCWRARRLESQRDSGLQPRVARTALPWEDMSNGRNPNGVVSAPRHGSTQPRWGLRSPRVARGATLGWRTESLWDSWRSRQTLWVIERVLCRFRRRIAVQSSRVLPHSKTLARRGRPKPLSAPGGRLEILEGAL